VATNGGAMMVAGASMALATFGALTDLGALTDVLAFVVITLLIGLLSLLACCFVYLESFLRIPRTPIKRCADFLKITLAIYVPQMAL
jgi:hypothetical protein